MFWDKLSKKEKIGLSISFAVMFIAFVDRLIVSPIRGSFERIDKAIKISEKQLEYDLRNVHLKEQVEVEFEKYVGYVERNGDDDEEINKVLTEIEALTSQSQVYLIDMKHQAPKKIDFYKEYSVEIEAEGEIEALTKFIHQINTSEQLLRVEKLRLNSKEDSDKALKSSMRITKVLVL